MEFCHGAKCVYVQICKIVFEILCTHSSCRCVVLNEAKRNSICISKVMQSVVEIHSSCHHEKQLETFTADSNGNSSSSAQTDAVYHVAYVKLFATPLDYSCL